jgi:hypothetical protein
MRVKVAEASDFVLDWMVLQTLDLKDVVVDHGDISFALHPGVRKYFRPSTAPEQAYPIIEREGIGFVCNRTAAVGKRFKPDAGADWRAFAYNRLDTHYYGPTPLIAAIRCYVVSKLGDEVEVPDELVEA